MNTCGIHTIGILRTLCLLRWRLSIRVAFRIILFVSNTSRLLGRWPIWSARPSISLSWYFIFIILFGLGAVRRAFDAEVVCVKCRLPGLHPKSPPISRQAVGQWLACGYNEKNLSAAFTRMLSMCVQLPPIVFMFITLIRSKDEMPLRISTVVSLIL